MIKTMSDNILISLQLCQFLCEQKPQMEKCGCYDHSAADVYHLLNISSTVDHCKTHEGLIYIYYANVCTFSRI
jgi:hypothetical protein